MKRGKFFGLILIFVFLSSVVCVYAHEEELFFPVEVHDGTTLSIAECVALSYKNNPKIRNKKYNLDIAKSNLGVARAEFFPSLNVGVGFYNENNSNSRDYEHYYRELPRLAVSLNQLIWDFGKTTAFIKMEEFYKIAAEYEFMDSLCATLFDIKEKYYSLLRARALMQIAENNLEINEDFVKISRKGAALNTAKINLNLAKVDYINAINQYNDAKINLANAMYLDVMPDFNVQYTPTFQFNDDYEYKSSKKEPDTFKPEKFPFKEDEALSMAYKASPDLHALEATKNAMKQSLLFVKRSFLPDLTANVGYGYNNTNIQSGNNSLQVGVALNSSVNAAQLRHSIKGADAQLNIADNEILLFKKDLYYELKRAFNNIEKSEQAVTVAQTNVRATLENLELVEKMYLSDKLDYTTLQQSRIDYVDSVNAYVESIFDYNMSLIQLEHAMHYHIVDIHHKSQHAVSHHSDDLIKHLNEVLNCDEHEKTKKFLFKKNKSDL